MPPSDRDATQDPSMLCYSIPKHCPAPFQNLLGKLNSLPEVPPVTRIVSDGVMSFAIKAAEELGIPVVQFWTASACGFMGYLHYSQLIQRGIVPFKGSFSFFYFLNFKPICDSSLRFLSSVFLTL